MQVLSVRPTSDRIEDFPVKILMTLANFKSQGNYCMHTRTLGKLKSSTRFTKFRFRCSSTNGSMHIKTTPNTTNGMTAVKYLTSYEINFPPPFCEAFAGLLDDESRAVEDCRNILLWSTIQGGRSIVQFRSIWSAGRHDEFICAETVEKTKLGDYWEVFVL